ncbi:PorT family protein [bacterium]|nr:PorT family protein [bacterium]
MIARFLLLSMLCFLSNITYAQKYYGANGGINFSNLHGSGTQAASQAKRINVGVFYGSPMGTSNYFQTECRYSSKGFTAKENGVKADYFLNYLEGAFIFRQDLFWKKHSYALAGTSVSFLLSDKVEVSSDGFSGTFDLRDLSPIDVNLIGGIGISGKDMLLELRYNYGIVEINEGGTYKNQAITLMVGFFVK